MRLQNETECGEVEVPAGRHMLSAPESQERDWLKAGPIWQAVILGTFSNFPRIWLVVVGGKEGEKKPNWPFENSAIRQRSKLAPKVDDFSGTFQDKAQLRVERAEDCFLGESKGLRK